MKPLHPHLHFKFSHVFILSKIYPLQTFTLSAQSFPSQRSQQKINKQNNNNFVIPFQMTIQSSVLSFIIWESSLLVQLRDQRLNGFPGVMVGMDAIFSACRSTCRLSSLSSHLAFIDSVSTICSQTLNRCDNLNTAAPLTIIF